ncbi:type II secretion system protein GspL [Sphingomonas arenae]|uniref:type II secretion system protein GspL n=1 Tax=Sphingomonas arenae TaxID=2812555 RepID=UPI001967AF98|nr:type II secretion system protein GspL [Sphingomonas arenae]
MTQLVLLLPEHPQPDASDTWWWRIADGEITECGDDSRWVQWAAEPGAELIGLASAGAVSLVSSEPVGATDRQASAVAAASAREASASDAADVHVVACVEGEGERRHALAAIVSAEVIDAWLLWCRSCGHDLHAIVPSLLLLPASDEDWIDARLGTEHLVGRGHLRFPYEEGLSEALIGDDRVRRVPADEVEAALVRLARRKPLNLRSGRFAARRGWGLDRGRARELLLLAACIPLLALLAAIISLVRLNRNSDRLDRETVEVASAALGRPVTAEAALAELDLVAARSGGAAGALSAPLASLYQQMQADPAVTATVLGWQGDGTLSATLAASRPEEINRVLLGLQRSGYRVTAVPRTGADGRQLAEITVKSAA